MTDVPRDLDRSLLRLGLKPVVHHPEMMLDLFRRRPKATPPPTGDVSRGITSFGMLGNGPDPNMPAGWPAQGVGDCVEAGTEHNRMTKGIYPADAPPSTPVTVDLYGAWQQDIEHLPPFSDDGTEPSSYLQWLFNRDQAAIAAGDDVKEWAWCETTTDLPTMYGDMLAFNGLLVCVNLTDYDQQDFQVEPWGTQTPVVPDQQLGHFILLVKYDGALHTYVTWGALQEATIDWTTTCITGAFAIVTAEDAEAAGVDYSALIAQCIANGGQGTQPPAPTPPPNPQPVPEPPPPAVNWRSTVESDVNAMQLAREDLNAANTVVADSALTAEEKATVHTSLARAAGVLQTQESADQELLSANPT